MKPQIGITTDHLQTVANTLGKILADENVLYIKTKNAHWNIEGADFYTMHQFFEGQLQQLDEIIDRVAERIRSIGHYAPASLKSFLELTHLTEMNRSKNNSAGFIKELLTDHESIVIILRKNITPFAKDSKDVGSSDFLTRILEIHEKMAWFLRSHLKETIL